MLNPHKTEKKTVSIPRFILLSTLLSISVGFRVKFWNLKGPSTRMLRFKGSALRFRAMYLGHRRVLIQVASSLLRTTWVLGRSGACQKMMSPSSEVAMQEGILYV